MREREAMSRPFVRTHRRHVAGTVHKLVHLKRILPCCSARAVHKTRHSELRSFCSFYYCDFIVFEKLHFQNFLRPHENEKPVFSKSSRLKSFLEKLRCREGLVWTEGLTVQIKLRIVHVVAALGRVLSRSTVSTGTSLG